MNFEIVNPSFEIITPMATSEGAKEYFGHILDIVELAGRNCYKTEERIEDQESRDKFLKGIINRGHLSVIEHGSITARLIGSRSMSHQLVRHRLCAYSQESQRYCNYSKGKFGKMKVICPISYGPLETLINGQSWWDGMETIVEKYNHATDAGIPPEDARGVLPNSCKTEIVMTTNFRVWRHIFNERCDKHAQWEIRALMCGLLLTFKKLVPVMFDDFVLQGGEEFIKFKENSFGTDYTEGEVVARRSNMIPELAERRPD